jgi:hypothetical protein
VTIAETVEQMIVDQIRKGVIADAIPGLMVFAGDNNVLMSVGSAVHIGLTPREAIALAAQVERIFKGEDAKEQLLQVRGIEVAVGRRGRALVVRVKDKDGSVATQSLTYSLARDLQRQLVKAAKYLAEFGAE